jgi:hypothetical protein
VSNFTVVKEISETLRTILFEGYKQAAELNTIVPSEAAIVFVNPKETAANSANRLSLWLYQVIENEFKKNQPPIRSNGPETLQFPPLTLNFHYLITPFTQTGEGDLLLLGKTLQVLYDNAIVAIRDPVNDIFEELRIVLCNLNLEQLTRVWEALMEPYRLSVCYEVRVTRVDSQRLAPNARVIDRVAGLTSGNAMDLAQPMAV